MKIIEPSYEILTSQDTMNGMIKRIEYYARVCYKSEDKITDDSAEKLIRMILKRGHESVIEHEWLSVRLICDRGISHEIVRHRLASYSQESTRYVDYIKETGEGGGDIQFINPIDFSIEQLSAWKDAMSIAESNYKFLRELGAKPEMARSVLPNSLKTEIVMTANLREWRHVFKLRTSKAAHPQMRQLMKPLLKELRKYIPVIFDDVGEVD